MNSIVQYKEFFEVLNESILFNEMKEKGESIMSSICIDGVVGVGKSSLVEIMESEFAYKPFFEPVTDNPILPKFYYDRARYSFPLQVFFLNKRFAMVKESERMGNTVLDRSIYGDVIFAKMLCQSGEMSIEEYELYKELAGNMFEHLKRPKLMVYLQTSVDNVIKKIQKRGRDYEQIVERSYWENLNSEYEAYFDEYNLSPLLVINVDNLDFVNNKEDREYVIGLIKEKLQEIEG